jgi:hypothetical protein
MEQIGRQVRLPLGRALQIAVQGIRIRFGRSLVTVTGVVLGVAFFMSNITSQLIRTAIAREREQRQTVNLMLTLVRGELGDPAGKTLAVAAFGELSDAERALLDALRPTPGLALRAHGLKDPAFTPAPPDTLGRGAQLLLALGNGPASVPPEMLCAGMTQPVLLDSLAERNYPENRSYKSDRSYPENSSAPAPLRRELFFGRESEEQAERLKLQAEQAAFRTAWIAIISVLVTVIGIANALLMSVTERFREIGTMKCLGALSAFIRKLFLIESAMIGLAGSVLGTLLGALLSFTGYGLTFGFGLITSALGYGALLAAAGACVAGGTLLAMLAAIYPANFAARMLPASALRTNV